MSHERLREYSVVAGGKMSKIIEFSRGEAEIFARNFIECRQSHAQLKLTDALKDITAYFSDTKYIKDKLNAELNKVTSGINETLKQIKNAEMDGQNWQSIFGFDPVAHVGIITDTMKTEAEKALEEAMGKLALAQENVKNVLDDADFNKEYIDQAKEFVADTIENLSSKGIKQLLTATETIGSDAAGEESTSIDLAEENKKLKNNLNKLRKWQLDKFEEEFSAELYVGSYHEYKYAKTLEELCELLNTAVNSLGADLELKAEDYKISDTEVVRKDNTKNIEEEIKQALKLKNIKFKRIDIDWHDKNYDPDNNDPFLYE